MKRAYGLDVPETLTEALDPERTALIVYDMQVGIMRQLQRAAEITAKVAQVLAAARTAGIRTCFLRHTSLPKNLMGVFQLRQALAWQRKTAIDEIQPWFLRGSESHEIVPELAPRDTEAVFDKIGMWEPGFWNLTDEEASAFRAYLTKGGFAVFEDFDGAQQWAHFEAQMRRVLPDGRLVRLDPTHPIFDSFFRVQDIDAIVHPMTGIRPSYYGIFEDNDPRRRLMVVANYDNDVPEYWEWSGEGLFPFDTSNEAYKLGVNYLIYGLTH